LELFGKNYNPDEANAIEGDENVNADSAEAAAIRLERAGRNAWADGTGLNGLTGKVKAAFLGDCTLPQELQAQLIALTAKKESTDDKVKSR
jgi:hypothetical protein